MTDQSNAAQGRDGRKDQQRRTGNDPQGPTGRAAGTFTPSAARVSLSKAAEHKLTVFTVHVYTYARWSRV